MRALGSDFLRQSRRRREFDCSDAHADPSCHIRRIIIVLMRSYRIAAIPGDGIGKEVIAAGLKVLDALCGGRGGFRLKFEHFGLGFRLLQSERRDDARGRSGHAAADFDAIYFGSVGAPDIPDHITLWGLRLAICQPFDQYANVRPARLLPGIRSPLRGVEPKDLDWVIVRENTEGEYAGHGGRSHRGLPEEVATEVSIFTRAGVARIMRFAFALARSRPRKLLTVVTKSNAQRNGSSCGTKSLPKSPQSSPMSPGTKCWSMR